MSVVVEEAVETISDGAARRARVFELVEVHGLTRAQAARRVGAAKTTVSGWFKEREQGKVAPLPRGVASEKMLALCLANAERKHELFLERREDIDFMIRTGCTNVFRIAERTGLTPWGATKFVNDHLPQHNDLIQGTEEARHERLRVKGA